MSSTTKPDSVAREILDRLQHFVDQRNAATVLMRMQVNDLLNYGDPGGKITVLDSLTEGSRIANDDNVWVKIADGKWEMQNPPEAVSAVVADSYTLAYNLAYMATLIHGEVLNVVSFD